MRLFGLDMMLLRLHTIVLETFECGISYYTLSSFFLYHLLKKNRRLLETEFILN